MNVRRYGKFTFGWQYNAIDCPVIILLGWKNKRFRLDYRRHELHQGWWRTVTKVKAWRIDEKGLGVISHYYFRQSFVH